MKQFGRSRQPSQRTWRLFGERERHTIQRALQGGAPPCCPSCGVLLEARAQSRHAQRLPLGARGYDLDCRPCRRFWCVVRHNERSLRLLRMRRFVAAVRAVENAPLALARQGFTF
jgi:hypothetical protein